jgi:hypothetical protein
VNIKRWFGIAILSCVALAPSGVNTQAPQAKSLTAAEAKNRIGDAKHRLRQGGELALCCDNSWQADVSELRYALPVRHSIYSAFKPHSFLTERAL